MHNNKKIFVFILIIIMLLGFIPETLAKREPLENRVLQIFNLSPEITVLEIRQILPFSKKQRIY